MIDNRKTWSLLVLIILLGCAAMRGAEPNEVATSLVFEESPVEVNWPMQRMPADGFDQIRQQNLIPTTIAAVTLPWPGKREMPENRLNFAGNGVFLNTLSVSQRQRALFQTSYRQHGVSMFRGRATAAGVKDDPNAYVVLFAAVSPEDAKEMARVYLRLAQSKYEQELQSLTDVMQRTKERIASKEKRLPELEELLKNSRASLETLRKAVPYRTDAEATAAIGELDRLINTARVEIAGVRAKIDAIHGYGQQAPAVAAKLEVMLVEESIALRAAEARRTEASSLRTQAARFVDLNNTLKEATEEKNQITGELRTAPNVVREQNQRLAEVKAQEPRVPDSKVFLYRVKINEMAPYPSRPWPLRGAQK
jgi:hypothetical protein